MPVAAPRACPRCPNMMPCPEHASGYRAIGYRGGSAKQGYNYRWQQARKRYLARHPLCVDCLPHVTEATVVDHIEPHRGDQRLFWDERNWQALCDRHHRAKTAREIAGRR